MSDDSNITDADGSQNTDADGSQNTDTEGEQKGEDLIVNDPDIIVSLKQLSEAAIDNLDQIQTPENIKNVVEAAIMAASKAISIDKILTLFSEKENEKVDKTSIRQAIEQLMQDYQSRGVELIEVSSGFRFQVAQTIAPWISRLWEERPQKYSRALLETLALVAYRQPVTRGEIEEIRGVSVSSQIMRTLIEREWVRVIGHRDVPGKPAMFATTKTFLDYFGLKKLDELPTLSEIRDLDVIDAELDFGDKDPANKNQEISDSSSKDKSDQENSCSIEKSPELKITLSIDSEQAESLTLKNDDESGEATDETFTEETFDEESLSSERIDIDAELSALKETYQQIDAIDKKNVEQDSFNVAVDENNSPSEPINIKAELNALKETQQQADAIDQEDAVPDSEEAAEK